MYETNYGKQVCWKIRRDRDLIDVMMDNMMGEMVNNTMNQLQYKKGGYNKTLESIKNIRPKVYSLYNLCFFQLSTKEKGLQVLSNLAAFQPSG